MYLRHLTLRDYRSYHDAQLPLTPEVTCLVGHNGQGKTNAVEAIGYLASLGSHRVATDQPLVRLGAEHAIIKGAVVKDEHESVLEIQINAGRANRARIGQSALPRPRDLLGHLRSVLFAPEDLALIKGDPGTRRRFLDDLLVQRQPRWSGVRSDYERIVKQRAALLKQAKQGSAISDDSLEIWDENLADLGSQLTYARLRLWRDLAPGLTQGYQEVSARSEQVTGSYRPHLGGLTAEVEAGAVPEIAEIKQALLTRMRELRRAEIERGVCLVGPHRDDLVFSMGALPAKGYASHGESWSLALALRLAAFELLRRDLRDDPVLILDDVFAELDSGRRERLAGLIGDAEQVIITAAVLADIPETLSATMHEIALEGVDTSD